MKAYSAEDKEDVDITVEIIQDPQTKDLQFEIVLTLKPGEDGLFNLIKFKEHEVTLTLISSVGTTIDVNIQDIIEWDVAATRRDNFEWGIDIDVASSEKEGASKLSEILHSDSEEDIKKVIKILNEITSDEATSEISLFTYNYPIKSLPGFMIGTDISLALHFDLSANLTLENDYSTNTTTGLRFIDREFSSYSAVHHDDGLGKASLKGRFDSKAGLNFDFYTMFFSKDIAHFSVQPEIGLYAEGYAGYTLFSDPTTNREVEDQNYGYFEPGLYYNGVVEGYLTVVLTDFEYLHEIEEQRFNFEQLTMGDYKIALGIEADKVNINAAEWLASPPEFTWEYYDVKTGQTESQDLNFDDLIFTLDDGTELQKQNLLLVIPETDAKDITVTARYDYSDSQFFEKEFNVGIIENKKVSLSDLSGFGDSISLVATSSRGSWAVSFTLSEDGTFVGDTYSIEGGMAELSAVYQNDFTGTFENIQKIDEYSYSMELAEITYARQMDEEWIENGIPHIATGAPSLDQNKNFVLYAPEKLTDDLPEYFVEEKFHYYPNGESSGQLTDWGLYSPDSEISIGFFGHGDQ